MKKVIVLEVSNDKKIWWRIAAQSNKEFIGLPIPVNLKSFNHRRTREIEIPNRMRLVKVLK